jgi:hypothetical protein
MITNRMIMTPPDTPGQITSRKVGQSHFLMATDTHGAQRRAMNPVLVQPGRSPLAVG